MTTCSLITLDKLLQDRPSLSRWFPKKVLALEVSFTAEQMREDTAERMNERTEFYSLPSPAALVNLLSSAGLSTALSDVDKLVYATAVQSALSVVTGDKRLAKAIQQQGLEVGNMALILQELVKTKKLKSTDVEKMLQALADRKEYLLGIPKARRPHLRDFDPNSCDQEHVKPMLQGASNLWFPVLISALSVPQASDDL